MSSGDAGSARERRRWNGVGPEERDAERRTRLLEAGLELFGTEGYAATSVAAISARAGFSTRSFYEHFADREALLGAVFEDIVGAVEERLDAGMTGCDDLEAMCWGGAAAVVDTYVDDDRRVRIVCREVIGVSPAIERLRAASQVRSQAVMLRHVGPFRASGEVADVDLRWALIGIIGAVQEILGVWVTLARRPPRRKLTADIGRLLHAGLTAPPLPPPGSRRS